MSRRCFGLFESGACELEEGSVGGVCDALLHSVLAALLQNGPAKV